MYVLRERSIRDRVTQWEQTIHMKWYYVKRRQQVNPVFNPFTSLHTGSALVLWWLRPWLSSLLPHSTIVWTPRGRMVMLPLPPRIPYQVKPLLVASTIHRVFVHRLSSMREQATEDWTTEQVFSLVTTGHLERHFGWPAGWRKRERAAFCYRVISSDRWECTFNLKRIDCFIPVCREKGRFGTPNFPWHYGVTFLFLVNHMINLYYDLNQLYWGIEIPQNQEGLEYEFLLSFSFSYIFASCLFLNLFLP